MTQLFCVFVAALSAALPSLASPGRACPPGQWTCTHQERIEGFNQYRSNPGWDLTRPAAPTSDSGPRPESNFPVLTPEMKAVMSAVEEGDKLVKNSPSTGPWDDALAAYERALAYDTATPACGDHCEGFRAWLQRARTRRDDVLASQAWKFAWEYLASRPNRLTPRMVVALRDHSYDWFGRCDPSYLAYLSLFGSLWDEDFTRDFKGPQRASGLVRQVMRTDEQTVRCGGSQPEARAAARRLAHLRQLVALRTETEPGFAASVVERESHLALASPDIAAIPAVRKGSPADKAQRAVPLMAVLETRAQGIALASDAARAGHGDGCAVIAEELRQTAARGHPSVFECSVMLDALRAGAAKGAAGCMARLGRVLMEGTPALSEPAPEAGLDWVRRAASKGDGEAKVYALLARPDLDAAVADLGKLGPGYAKLAPRVFAALTARATARAALRQLDHARADLKALEVLATKMPRSDSDVVQEGLGAARRAVDSLGLTLADEAVAKGDLAGAFERLSGVGASADRVQVGAVASRLWLARIAPLVDKYHWGPAVLCTRCGLEFLEHFPGPARERFARLKTQAVEFQQRRIDDRRTERPLGLKNEEGVRQHGLFADLRVLAWLRQAPLRTTPARSDPEAAAARAALAAPWSEIEWQGAKSAVQSSLTGFSGYDVTIAVDATDLESWRVTP